MHVDPMYITSSAYKHEPPGIGLHEILPIDGARIDRRPKYAAVNGFGRRESERLSMTMILNFFLFGRTTPSPRDQWKMRAVHPCPHALRKPAQRQTSRRGAAIHISGTFAWLEE